LRIALRDSIDSDDQGESHLAMEVVSLRLLMVDDSTEFLESSKCFERHWGPKVTRMTSSERLNEDEYVERSTVRRRGSPILDGPYGGCSDS